jgi:hypothetical protein
LAPPSAFPVIAAVENQEYEGTYYVDAGIVYVESEYGGNKTQLGRTPAATLAAMMLADIIRAAISRGEIRKGRPSGTKPAV